MHHCRMSKHEVSPPLVTVLEMKSRGLIFKEADEPIRMTDGEVLSRRWVSAK